MSAVQARGRPVRFSRANCDWNGFNPRRAQRFIPSKADKMSAVRRTGSVSPLFSPLAPVYYPLLPVKKLSNGELIFLLAMFVRAL
jgi:hypothetical protein